MEHLPISEAQWIRQQTKPWPPEDFAREGTAVHHLIPPVYESYGRILHPFEINVKEPDTLERNPYFDRPVSITMRHLPDGGIKISEQRGDGTVVDLHEEFLRKAEERKRHTQVPTCWRTVAEKYGLTFHTGINITSYTARFRKTGWPRNLLYPSEGFLPRDLLLDLLALLEPYTQREEVYIYQALPHSISKDGRSDDLVRCSLSEVPEYFTEGFIGYLYAADRSWMVYTNTDFHFTLVGGSKALLEALKNSEMEVLECSAATRVDDYIDRLNEPPPQLSSPPLHQELRPCRLGKEHLVPKRHSIFNRFMQWLTGK